MLRVTTILSLAMVAFGGAAQAGTVTWDPINLTTTSVGLAQCSGLGCTFPAATFSSTGSYMNEVFSATNPVAPPPSFTGISLQNATTGSTTTPFSLNTASNTNQAFYEQSTSNNANDEIVVNLGTGTAGVFGISQLYTLIQANGEASAWQGVTITVSGVDGASNPVNDVITFTSGTDYRGSNSGTSVIGTIDGSGTTINPSGNSHTETSGSITNTITVYNDGWGTQTASGTNYFTDVQEIDLGGAFQNAYIDSITIASVAASGSKERLLFSGLTLATSTPEPGSLGLIALGLSLGVLVKKRLSRIRG